MLEDQVYQIFESRTGKKIAKLKKLNGLSNHVFKVIDGEGVSWIFKILRADHTDPFKKLERIAMNLVAEIDNSLIFDDEHYRIEKFIPNDETTFAQVMHPVERLKIMRAIAGFNRLQKIDNSKPNLYRIIENDSKPLFDKIKSNLSLLDQKARDEFRVMLADVQQIAHSIQVKFKADSMVISHNDIFYRNVIYDNHKNRYVLIDFEYGGYNPLGMDVFQFVSEFLIDYDVEETPYFKLVVHNYPSEESLKEMIRFYLFFYDHAELVSGKPDTDELISHIRTLPQFKEIGEHRVQEIHSMFPYFGVITNIFWFYWGLYIFRIENINLDYVEFARAKYRMVQHFKDML
jgi:thiamine kinase-like enzyme